MAAAFCLIAACTAQTALAQQGITPRIVPAVPKAMQPAYAVLDLPGCLGPSSVTHENGLLVIKLVSFLCGTPPPGTFPETVSLGRLPAGNYRMAVFAPQGNGFVPFGPEVPFTVAPPEPHAYFDDVFPITDGSGWWWNAQRTGEGWFVEHHFRDKVMVGWVTYRTDGSPEWYVMQSTTRNNNLMTGPIYRAQGTPPNVTLTQVGTASFEVITDNQATFTYTATGQAPSTVNLQRLPF